MAHTTFRWLSSSAHSGTLASFHLELELNMNKIICQVQLVLTNFSCKVEALSYLGFEAEMLTIKLTPYVILYPCYISKLFKTKVLGISRTHLLWQDPNLFSGLAKLSTLTLNWFSVPCWDLGQFLFNTAWFTQVLFALRSWHTIIFTFPLFFATQSFLKNSLK